MLSLLTFPFKLLGLVLSTAFALLRTATGLLGLLLNPFVLVIAAIAAAAMYFR